MNALGNLAFGTLSPAGVANVAKNCAGIFGRQAASGLGLSVMPTTPEQQMLAIERDERDRAQIALVAAGVGVGLLLVGLRFGAAWYIGKQFGRGASGAVVGGLFGAPGLGLLSLFPKD